MIRESYFRGKPVLTDAQLLSELYKKIESKSVGTNIKKIMDGKVSNKYSVLKTYFSLGTHAMIECEHGNEEYLLLIENILNKIYSLL